MIGKWDITSACNLHCTHCCTGGRDYKTSTRTLPLTEVRTVMESLRDAGVRKLQFTGGEPLLRRDLPEVLAMTSEYFDGAILNTHGLFFQGPWLSRERLSRFEQIIFSLDGPDAETHEAVRGPGTFAPLVRNVRAATDAIAREGLSITVTMNAILSKRVVNRARDFIALTKELGAQVFAINSVVMVANAKKHAADFTSVTWADKYRFVEEMVEAGKELGVDATFEATPLGYAFINLKCGTHYRTVFHCGAARTGVYIQADGHAHPCMRATEDMPALAGPVEPPDLTRHSMREVLGSEYFQKFETLQSHDQTDLEPCGTCKFRDHCSACRFEYARQGKVDECIFLNSALDALVADAEGFRAPDGAAPGPGGSRGG